jgi:hypothetical protein
MSKLKLGRDYIKEQELDLMVKDSISSDVKIIDSEFDKQLRSFKQDSSYKDRFKRCELNDSYGIEIFLFKPKKDASVGLLLVNNGKTSNTKDQFHATNIAKIIKVGKNMKDPLYKEGDLVLLPYSMITGFTPNPKYAMYHQLDDSNYKPIVDEVVSPSVYTFVATLGQYAWLPPQEFDVEDENITTYYVHQDLIIGLYKY